MATNWYDTMASGDTITFENWNDMVDEIHIKHNNGLSGSYLSMSGSFQSHEGDSTIHYAQGSINHTNLLNIGSNSHAQIDTKLTSYAGHSSNTDVHIKPTSGYKNSSVAWNGSSWIATKSGGTSGGGGGIDHIKEDTDISSWDSGDYTNSGLKWNGANWIAGALGGAGAGINAVAEDGTPQLGGTLGGKGLYGISSITYLSSNGVVSGSTVYGHSISSAKDMTTWNSSSFTDSGIKWNGSNWVAAQFGAGGGGGLTHISGDTQISSWDEGDFTNSGLQWNGTNWIAKSMSGVGGGINNVVEDGSPQLGGDLDGQDSYGIDDVTFVSSNAISSASIIGGLHYPANYVIYFDGTNYISKNCKDGSIGYTNQYPDRTIEETWKLLSPSGGIIQLIADSGTSHTWTLNQSISSQSDNTKIISQQYIRIEPKNGMTTNMINILHDYVTLDGFHLRCAPANDGHSIYISSASHPMVYNTWIWNSAADGIHHCSDQGVGNYDRLHIRNGTGWGFVMQASDNCLTNSDIEGNGKGGLSISGNGYENFISNVHLGWHNGGEGLFVKGYRNTICNITIDEPITTAMRLSYGFFNLINGVRIRGRGWTNNETGSFIIVEGCGSCSITNVNVDSNHDYYHPERILYVNGSYNCTFSDFTFCKGVNDEYVYVNNGSNNLFNSFNIRPIDSTVDTKIGVKLNSSEYNTFNDFYINNCAYGFYITDEDESMIHDCYFYSCPSGIVATDGDNLSIQGCHFQACTYPININNSNVVSPLITDNYWRGCTNDPLYASATNERITDNIDKNGAFWSVDGNAGGGGGLAHISSDTQITSWDEGDFTNSGLKWNGTAWIAGALGGVGAGINSVSEDGTPQLGGHLGGQSTYGISSVTFVSSNAISSNSITGKWTVPLFDSKSAAGAASTRPGQIVRVSGGSDEGTWLFVSMYNSLNSWEWVQLGVTN